MCAECIGLQVLVSPLSRYTPLFLEDTVHRMPYRCFVELKLDNSLCMQSIGVWSDGIYVSPVVKKYSGSRESSASRAPRKSTEKPKPNLRLIKKAEDEEKFKDLLEDDSNEDNDDPDIEDDFLTLPINENGNVVIVLKLPVYNSSLCCH